MHYGVLGGTTNNEVLGGSTYTRLNSDRPPRFHL